MYPSWTTTAGAGGPDLPRAEVRSRVGGGRRAVEAVVRRRAEAEVRAAMARRGRDVPDDPAQVPGGLDAGVAGAGGQGRLRAIDCASVTRARRRRPGGQVAAVARSAGAGRFGTAWRRAPRPPVRSAAAPPSPKPALPDAWSRFSALTKAKTDQLKATTTGLVAKTGERVSNGIAKVKRRSKTPPRSPPARADAARERRGTFEAQLAGLRRRSSCTPLRGAPRRDRPPATGGMFGPVYEQYRDASTLGGAARGARGGHRRTDGARRARSRSPKRGIGIKLERVGYVDPLARRALRSSSTSTAGRAPSRARTAARRRLRSCAPVRAC